MLGVTLVAEINDSPAALRKNNGMGRGAGRWLGPPKLWEVFQHQKQANMSTTDDSNRPKRNLI